MKERRTQVSETGFSFINRCTQKKKNSKRDRIIFQMLVIEEQEEEEIQGGFGV